MLFLFLFSSLTAHSLDLETCYPVCFSWVCVLLLCNWSLSHRDGDTHTDLVCSCQLTCSYIFYLFFLLGRFFLNTHMIFFPCFFFFLSFSFCSIFLFFNTLFFLLLLNVVSHLCFSSFFTRVYPFIFFPHIFLLFSPSLLPLPLPLFFPPWGIYPVCRLLKPAGIKTRHVKPFSSAPRCLSFLLFPQFTVTFVFVSWELTLAGRGEMTWRDVTDCLLTSDQIYSDLTLETFSILSFALKTLWSLCESLDGQTAFYSVLIRRSFFFIIICNLLQYSVVLQKQHGVSVFWQLFRLRSSYNLAAAPHPPFLHLVSCSYPWSVPSWQMSDPCRDLCRNDSAKVRQRKCEVDCRMEKSLEKNNDKKTDCKCKCQNYPPKGFCTFVCLLY